MNEPVIIGLTKDQLNPRHFGGMCSRETVVLRTEGEINFDEGIETIATTEAPAIVVDWERWEYVREVLPMRYCDIPKEDTPFLDSHLRAPLERVIGRAFDYRAEKDMLLNKAFISSTEEKIRTKIKEKIIKNVSLGYSTTSERTVEVPKGAVVTIDGVEYRNEYEDGLPFLVRTYWKPRETSAVAIGADDRAKFRALLDGKTLPGDKGVEKKYTTTIKTRSSNMEKTQEEILQEAIGLERAKWDKDHKERSDKEKKDAVENSASILQLVGDFQKNIPGVSLSEEGRKFIQEGKSFKEFYDFCAGKMREASATRKPDIYDGADSKDLKDYSLARALLAMSNPGEFAKLGIEREIHQTIQRKLGRDVGNALIIPTLALNVGGSRSQVVGTPTLGGNTVLETPVGISFIEYLHNTLAFVNAGVQVLDNLSGDIPLIREASEHTLSFKAESVAPDASDVTFTKETYGPKLGGVLTTISRQMLLQSPMVSEAWARRKLLGATMRGLDRIIPYGAGGVEPEGFKMWSGTNPIVGAGFGRERAISMRQSVRAVNAEIGSFNFVTNTITKGILENVNITPEKFLVDENGKMVGLPVKDSNQVNEGDLFYGGWANIYLMLWGYILIEANPWGSGWAAGDIQVKANVATNVMGEYPQAIAIAEDVAPAAV